MSLGQVLSHLRVGELIIVRDGANSLRQRLSTGPGRTAAAGASAITSRKLLRNLIAARKGGKK
jgi:hypothetical protein